MWVLCLKKVCVEVWFCCVCSGGVGPAVFEGVCRGVGPVFAGGVCIVVGPAVFAVGVCRVVGPAVFAVELWVLLCLQWRCGSLCLQ